ncbi:transcription factor SEF1 [Apiospora marii]|uniref:Transcription factor SEF1 n=1 Tax=Apiospora marii TaxID=335849 RepID=A0ABR1RD23_9PEZI
MHLGLAPLISQPGELRTIKSLFNAYHGPREFLTQVKVQQLISSFASMLWPSNNDLLVDVSLVQTIDEKLDEISDEQVGISPDSTAFTILTAKLHMYAAIVSRAPADSTSRSIILKMGLGAALRIIDLAQSIMPRPAAAPAAHDDGSSSSDENTRLAQLGLTREDCQRALHKKHFLAVVFATVFLLRYFSLNSAAPADEQQRAANHVLAAHGLFRSWSLEPADEYARAAVLFETLCRQAPHSADTQKLRLTDRMGVSILFDAISTAHELRGGPSEVVVDEQATATTPPGDGGDDDGAEASTGGVNRNRNELPTRTEKGKEVAVQQAGSVSEGDMPAAYVDGMNVTMEGQGYDTGLPSDFFNDPMWEVFNFDFEAAAAGQYPGDFYLPQQ